MKTMKSLKKITIVALTLAVAWSCSKDDAPSESVYDIIAANPNFETFLNAVHRVGMDEDLKDNGNDYTVFVPDEAGFNAFLAENAYADIDAVPLSALTELVRNHIVEGQSASASSLSGQGSGYLSTLAEGSTTANRVDMLFHDNFGDLTLNGMAVVTEADINTSNGTIHRVDAVIEIASVLTFINGDPELARLKDAVAIITVDDPSYSEDLADFNVPAPYTVLAPENDAVDNVLANELGGTTLQDLHDNGDLEDIVDAHIIANNNIVSSDISDGMVIQTQNGNATANVEGSSISFTDPLGRTINVIRADIQAGNGVIHLLDSVLLSLQL